MPNIIRIVYVFAITFNMGLYAFAAETDSPIETQKTATLAAAKGTVEVKPSTEKAVWVAGTPSTSLVQGDIIRTGKDSTATIRINEGAGSIVIELASDSVLSIAKLITDVSTDAKDVMLNLDLGEAMVRMKNTDKRSNFEIKTPTSVVSSQGGSSSFSVQTEFSK